MQPYIDALASLDMEKIRFCSHKILSSVSEGGRIFTAGNGGSSAIAQHFASDLMKPVGNVPQDFSAVCLSDNPAMMTAISNDVGYDFAFSHAAETHGLNAEDMVICFSVSGRSPNLLKLRDLAQERECSLFAIRGKPYSPNQRRCFYTNYGFELLAVNPKIEYGTPLYYSVCESAFSCIAHEIARAFHILRGTYDEQEG